MKLSLSLVLVTLAALGAAQGPARCSNIRVRRNAASLSQQEWRSISNVLQRMHQDGLITSFGAAHDRLFNRIHGNTCFFPFHRRFLVEFENIARRYDPNFTVPYWDATQSYRNPASDPLLTSTALGTNGQNQDRCLTDGIQANTQLSYPNNHCLRRNWNNGNSISPWYAPEIISSYIRSDTSLSRFRENIEYSIHGAVHLGLAGEMDSGYAAHDFTFMVHHANLDRLWWDWQNAHNSFLMYDGTGSNGPASIRDIIPDDNSVPFGGSTVESVMVLGFGNVCYTYDSSSNPPQSYPGSNNNGVVSQQRQQAQPQDAPNSNPAISGSSNVSNRAIENDRLQRALGSNDIDRFFPGLNGGTSALRRRAYQEKKERCAQGKPLTFPDRLTPEWIKMHGFDPERVEMFHNNACQIVELLNNSTYTSPY